MTPVRQPLNKIDLNQKPLNQKSTITSSVSNLDRAVLNQIYVETLSLDLSCEQLLNNKIPNLNSVRDIWKDYSNDFKEIDYDQKIQQFETEGRKEQILADQDQTQTFLQNLNKEDSEEQDDSQTLKDLFPGLF